MAGQNQNSASDNTVNNQLVNLRYLTTSQECEVFEQIAWKGYTDIKDVQNKFFRHHPDDLQQSRYLQNKYLYIFTAGVINYLKALKKAEESSKRYLNINEPNTVSNHIFDTMDNNANISIVSLGSGTSLKEIQVIKELISKSACSFDYYPIDVSINLLQLSMLNFSKKITDNLDRVKIHPIVADFWKLADYVKLGNNNLFGDKPRIFLLFGNTFGNYYENDLLNQIMPIMKPNDQLFIGLDTWGNINSDVLKEKDRVLNENSAFETTRWLLHPLNHIPFYKGFLSEGKYLKNSIKYEQNQEKHFITAVNDTICYTLCLDVEEKIIAPHGMDSAKIPIKIRIASTTKYKLQTLYKWFCEFKYENGKEVSTFSVRDPIAIENSAVFCLEKCTDTKENDSDSGLPDLKREANES